MLLQLLFSGDTSAFQLVPKGAQYWSVNVTKLQSSPELHSHCQKKLQLRIMRLKASLDMLLRGWA